MKKLIYLLLICIFCVHSVHAQIKLDTLDTYITDVLKTFNSPGLSIAIVSNDKIIYNKGFGTKTIHKNESVTTETQFAIGSITKSFTPVALAMLVDEGKLNWDDKVVQYLPSFELYKEYVTNAFTIRDLLTHRSGLKPVSGGTLMYHSDLTRDEVIAGIKHLQPESEFRTKAAYQNIMFIVAAKVVEVISGDSWEDFIRARVFAPLGMSRTIILEEERDNSKNISTPHIKNDKFEVIPIRQEKLDNVGPAGSFYSTSTDMAHYMMFVMNKGVFKGDTLIQPDTFKELLTPQSHFRSSILHNEFTSYGFGWWLTPIKGHKIIQHSGGVDGASANIIMVDDLKFGVVALDNSSNWSPFKISVDIVGNEIDEESYKTIGIWMKKNANRSDSLAQISKQKFIDSQIQQTNPSLALTQYTGTFSDQMYGDVVIAIKQGKLTMEFEHTELFSGNLSHWHYDTFKLGDRDPRIKDGLITFEFSSLGEIIGFNIDQPNLLDVDFSEVKFNKIIITEPKPG